MKYDYRTKTNENSGDSHNTAKRWHFIKCLSRDANKFYYPSKHKKPTKGAFGGMSKFNKKLKAEKVYLNVITSTEFDTLDEHKKIINFNNWNAEKVA